LLDYVKFHATKLGLVQDETVEKDVVPAILAQPKLRALTTNARSAHFLMESIIFFSSSHARGSWTSHLNEFAPALTVHVVHCYMDENGIKDLGTDQRRLVAASVFHELQEAQMDAKTGNYRSPDFLKMLDLKEKAVALGLITSNTEWVASDDTVKLVEGTEFAITVSPAIAIVLFTMAGGRVSMKQDWKAEEEVAALYAVQKNMLEVFRSISQQVDGVLSQNLADDVKRKPIETLQRTLLAELNKVNIYALSQRIETPRQRKGGKGERRGTVKVPLVNRRSILVNGATASFADVMAPFMLMQSKHTSRGSKVEIELREELRKCCLLMECEDDRPLRGMLAVWQGAFDSLNDRQLPLAKAPPKEACDEQHSKAFPANLVKYGAPIDIVKYGLIEAKSSFITIGDRIVELPRFEKNETITYIIVTNARAVRIKLGEGCSLTIDEGMLMSEMNLDTAKLNSRRNVGDEEVDEEDEDDEEETFNQEATADEEDAVKKKWHKLMGELKEGVTIKFLFTRSG
jgi:hypothetical protein